MSVKVWRPADPAAATRPERGTHWLLSLSAILMLVAACGVAGAIWQLRRDALDDARRDSFNLALVLAQQTEHAVQAMDIVLQQTVDSVRILDTNTDGVFERVIGGALEYAKLRSQLSQLPQAEALTILDKDGFIVNTTRVFPARRLDLRDRDFYQHFLAHDEPGAFISVPVRNRTTNTWSLYVARRLNSAEGDFLGVVIAAVGLEAFDALYRNMRLQRGEKLLLVRRDGVSLAGHPMDERRIARKMPEGSPWYGVVARGGGHYDSGGPFSGTESLVAVATLRAYPLALNVLIPREAVLATWRRQAEMLGSGAAVLLLCAMALMIAVHRRQRAMTAQNHQLVAITGELRQNRELVLEQAAEFQTTLENMDQGIFLIDHEGRIVVHNRQVLELLKLPGALLRSRPLLRDILEYQWNVNGFRYEDVDFDIYIKVRTDISRTYTAHLEFPDGRLVEVRNTPTPSGGAVRIYTDVTARVLAERRVRYLAQHDELTHLVNRAHFAERLVEAVEQARERSTALMVMYLDLDGFKAVNDEHGHRVGDGLLVEVARRMQDAVQGGDVVARIGGDEFAIILPSLAEPALAGLLAQHLIGTIGNVSDVDGKPVAVGASIGIARFPTDGRTPEELLPNADAALYEAKRAGKNRACFYRSADASRIVAAE